MLLSTVSPVAVGLGLLVAVPATCGTVPAGLDEGVADACAVCVGAIVPGAAGRGVAEGPGSRTTLAGMAGAGGGATGGGLGADPSGGGGTLAEGVAARSECMPTAAPAPRTARPATTPITGSASDRFGTEIADAANPGPVVLLLPERLG